MKTLGEATSRIKREARLESGSDFDELIVDMVNEAVSDYTSKAPYSELLVPDVTIATTASTGYISLPDDFQHIVPENIFFQVEPNVSYPIYPQGSLRFSSTIGSPRFWRIVGRKIYIVPFSEVIATNSIRFDYYRVPTPLEDDADEFEIDSLYDAVINSVLAKLKLFDGKPALYQAYKGEANSKFINSRAIQP